MERDLDKKLYNDYLKGKKQAFEYLYNKYKSKIEYFIYNIVKDYQKAEDLTQETFIYVMQNKMKENSSFKYYIYLVAKSKALNYINKEKRRKEIDEQYIVNENEYVEKDVLDIITKQETKKDLLDSINELEDKYKNAIYLVNIEELSYEETANILGQTLQNTKSLIHRGKKQLRKILLKKGFDEMNKCAKVSIIIICATILMTGIAYAGIVIYNEYIKKQEQIQSRGLFDLGDGITTYEINLMANDMIWNENSRLYHRLISNKEDLTIYNVNADENTTHIIMKQKENPNYNNENNIWYAIIDKSLLRENADVTIENREIDTRNFTKAKDLPKDYSVQNAIQDGCIVLENNKIKSNNIDLLDEFIETTDKRENAFIRVYSTQNNNKLEGTYIKDVEYYNGIYYVSDYSLKGNERSYFNSFTNKLTKSQTSLGTCYYWLSEDGMNGTPFIMIQD